MCIHTHPHTHVHTEICLLSSAAQQALGPQRRIKAASKLSGKKRRCYIPPATFCRITENVFNGAAELYISTLLVKKKKKERKKNSTSTQSPTALQSKALYPRWHCINCDGLWRKHIYILSPIKWQSTEQTWITRKSSSGRVIFSRETMNWVPK